MVERYPPPPVGVQVCCHCRRPLVVYRVLCDGHEIETFHCAEHGGATVPMWSAVVNRTGEWPDWSAA